MTIYQEIEEEFPGFKLVDKTKENTPWWLWPFFVMASWVNKDFFTRYATVVGVTIYIPSRRKMGRRSLDALLRHERVHMRDARDFGPLYYLSYLLFPLPAWVTFRWWWELRAYSQTLIVWHERDGITTEDVEWLVGVFAGPGYGWMNPWRKFMTNKILELKHMIESGVASGPHWPHEPPDKEES